MPRSFWFGSLSILLLASLLFLFVSCFEQPVSPYQPVNTKLYLSVQSSTLQFTIGQYYVDTVGDSINIGVTSNLPQFVDSVTVGIFSDAYLVEQGTILKNINASGKDPTWFKTLLNKDGKKYIIAKAFIQDGYKSFDTIIVNVLPRQAATTPRSKPHITVNGLTTIAAGQVCSLSVTVNDSTVGQTHTFFAKQDTQSQFSVFTPPFMWTPPMGFTGTSTVLFKVADSDSPSYFDTQTVVMTVLAVSPINHAPKWAKDTVSLTGAAGTALNLTLMDKCTGDSLLFSLADAPALAGDTIINSVYSYTFAANDTTTYWPKVIATDKQGKADTMTLHLWATPTPMSGPKALTAFSFTNPAVTGTVNESAKTVALTVPYGTDVTTLVALFTTTGASVKVGSTTQTSGTTANNFTNPVTYTVVATDGNTQAYTVTVTIAANSGKTLTAFSFTTPAVTGTINESAKTVALTVPFGTDVTALVATFTVSSGASAKVGSTAQTSATTANNFTSPVTYTVVAGDGSTQAYVVTVTIVSNTAKALTAFSFTTPAVTGTINETAKTVALTVPYGTDVTALIATFASTGASVKVGTTAQISGTTANNFTSPATYMVVAADGSTQAYVVTVIIAANTAKALTAFSFTSPVATGTINETAKTIALTVPFGTDVTALVATFASTGSSVKIGTTAQTSGTTANNFSSPITYTVVANDGSTQAYVVTVAIAANTAKAMIAFSFTSPAATGTITGTNIAVTVPSGTDVTALVATFTSTGASVKVGSSVQTSGTTVNTFSSPVTYTVVASDGSTQAYVVTVTVAANSGKSITAFSFASLSVTGTINESAKTISVAVPYNTDVSGLIATFTLSAGASVKVGSAAQVSGTTPNSFANAVTYTVTAADGTTQSYAVTVTVTPNSAKAITSFNFAGLNPVATGTITGTNIAVTVPYATDVTTLVATFITTGASVKVGTAVQASGTTINDFSKPVSYTVFAADGGAQSYTVAVAVAANMAKAITAFSFTSPAVTGTITGTNIAVTVPYGTTLTGLIATFSTSGASVKVGSAVQTSGTTSNSFTTPVTYIVVAADGSTQSYVVTVTQAAKPTYQLTVTAGTGGTITAPTTSPLTVNQGDATTITAAPNTGYKFVNWTGPTGAIIASATSASTTVTLNSANATITANFTKITYQLTVIAGTGGTITAPTTSPSTVNQGDATTITAAPGTGYKFVNWTGPTGATIASATSASTTVTLTSADATITANFAKITYQLTVTPGTGGTITAPTTSPSTVNQGDATTITAAPGTGYKFVNWTGPTGATIASATSASTTVTLTSADATITANFAKITYQLTVTAGTGGTITTPNSLPATVNYGAATSIVAAPSNSGYAFVNWTVTNGTATIANATSLSTTVTLTSGNATVTANFTPVYTVSYSGTGAPSDPNKYHTNDSVTVLGAGSLVNSGFTLQGWTLNGVMYTIGAKFKIGASNVTLTPSWAVMDREGNIYDTVTINGTIWMKQNLKTRSITLGNPMLIRNGSDWAANPSTPKCCFYGFNGSDNSGLGAFYNAAAVTSNNLAPDGWHVATINEYNNLMPTGNASSVAITGTNFWIISGTNETGFSAVGAGYCDSIGNFYDYQVKTYFATSDGVDISQLYIYKMTVFMMNLATMPTSNCGFSVRCAKNP